MLYHFFSGKTRHLFIHQYSIGAHHGSFMDPTNKKNKQTNNNRFLVVGLLYEILVIVCSILDWCSLHYLLQFSKLWEERKKKKSIFCLPWPWAWHLIIISRQWNMSAQNGFWTQICLTIFTTHNVLQLNFFHRTAKKMSRLAFQLNIQQLIQICASLIWIRYDQVGSRIFQNFILFFWFNISSILFQCTRKLQNDKTTLG